MTSSGAYATLKMNSATASGRPAIFDYERSSLPCPYCNSSAKERRDHMRTHHAETAATGGSTRLRRASLAQFTLSALQGLPLWLDETRPAPASRSPVGAGLHACPEGDHPFECLPSTSLGVNRVNKGCPTIGFSRANRSPGVCPAGTTFPFGSAPDDAAPDSAHAVGGPSHCSGLARQSLARLRMTAAGQTRSFASPFAGTDTSVLRSPDKSGRSYGGRAAQDDGFAVT